MYKVNKRKLSQSDYPPLLAAIPTPPQELYIAGSLDKFYDSAASIAVIGTRKPTPYGRGVTESLVTKLAHHNTTVVSGLALGVDAIAHQSALRAAGNTIAVLPCGLDQICPKTNQQLAWAIIESGGALISEYPDNTPPLRPNFVARNRLVSGLSNAVLITEAAHKSGTLHTANFALEQGRTVLAVPGNITSLHSKGTNQLIASGARMVTDIEDILDELGLTANQRQTTLLPDTEEESIIIDLLTTGMSDGKQLLETSKLEAARFNQTITMLEISGKIKALGADNWSLQ